MYKPINSFGYSCIKKLQRDNLWHAYNEPINFYSAMSFWWKKNISIYSFGFVKIKIVELKYRCLFWKLTNKFQTFILFFSLESFLKTDSANNLLWLSPVGYNYKPGYKPCDLL